MNDFYYTIESKHRVTALTITAKTQAEANKIAEEVRQEVQGIFTEHPNGH